MEAAMKPIRLALGLIAVLAVACQGPTVPSLETLLAVPLKVPVGLRFMTLETYVYRDFMPGSNSDLIAACLITAEDGQPYPSGLDADKIWAINGDDVWEGDFTEEAGPPDQTRLHQLRKVAYGGPKWELGTEIEVVVRLVLSSGGRQLLRATAQKIGAAY
jgi:hypothetical protein